MGNISSIYGSVQVAEEGSYGGGAASSSDDALPLVDPFLADEAQRTIDRDGMFKPGPGGYPHARVDDNVSYGFTVRVGELDLDNDDAPAVGPLFLGAGFSESVSGGADNDDLTAEYTLQDFGKSSVEVLHQLIDRDNGDLAELTIEGARHNLMMSGEVENDLTLEVDGQGLHAERGTFSSGTGASTIGLGLDLIKAINVTATWGGTTLEINSFSMDVGHEINQTDELSGSSYADEIYIVESRPSIEVNPLWKASYFEADDLEDDLRSGAKEDLEVQIDGENTRVIITAKDAQCEEKSLEDDSGMLRRSLTMRANESTFGDYDDLTVTFEQI